MKFYVPNRRRVVGQLESLEPRVKRVACSLVAESANMKRFAMCLMATLRAFWGLHESWRVRCVREQEDTESSWKARDNGMKKESVLKKELLQRARSTALY